MKKLLLVLMLAIMALVSGCYRRTSSPNSSSSNPVPSTHSSSILPQLSTSPTSTSSPTSDTTPNSSPTRVMG